MLSHPEPTQLDEHDLAFLRKHMRIGAAGWCKRARTSLEEGLAHSAEHRLDSEGLRLELAGVQALEEALSHPRAERSQ
jgi:hypothetical protein